MHEYPHNYTGKVSNNIFELFVQIYLSTKSLISGLIPYKADIYYLVFFIALFFIFLFLLKSKKEIKECYYIVVLYIFSMVNFILF